MAFLGMGDEGLSTSKAGVGFQKLFGREFLDLASQQGISDMLDPSRMGAYMQEYNQFLRGQGDDRALAMLSYAIGRAREDGFDAKTTYAFNNYLKGLSGYLPIFAESLRGQPPEEQPPLPPQETPGTAGRMGGEALPIPQGGLQPQEQVTTEIGTSGRDIPGLLALLTQQRQMEAPGAREGYLGPVTPYTAPTSPEPELASMARPQNSQDELIKLLVQLMGPQGTGPQTGGPQLPAQDFPYDISTGV